MIRSLSFFFFLASILFLTACGNSNLALNSAKKTNQLQPGMTYEEVVAILGKPKSSRFENNLWINRWVLQEQWVGYVPYDMVFDPQTKTLISWSRNEKDFQKKQEKEIVHPETQSIKKVNKPIRLIPIFILNFRIENEINDLLISTNRIKTGLFKHYKHEPEDPHSLSTNQVISVYLDRRHDLWLRQVSGSYFFK